jgi:hypothetical protein
MYFLHLQVQKTSQSFKINDDDDDDDDDDTTQ